MIDNPSSEALGAFGVTFGLRGPAAATGAIRVALADRTSLSVADGEPDVSYEIRPGERITVVRRVGSETVLMGRADSPATAADLIGDDIHQQIAHRSDGYLLVHAGAVAWNGAAVAVPGRTRAGKSTLVAAMIAEGAEYLSDEFAVLDRHGLVHPYPRKLSMRDGQGGSRAVDVSEIGGVAATEPRPLALIVSTRYEPGARWQPTSLAGSRALLPLIDNSVVARTRSGHTMSTVAGLGDRVTTLVGLRGEADETARSIRVHTERMADGAPATGPPGPSA